MTLDAPPAPPAAPPLWPRPGKAEWILASVVAFHGILVWAQVWSQEIGFTDELSSVRGPLSWLVKNPVRLLMSPAHLVAVAATTVSVAAVLLARRAPRFAAWGSIAVTTLTIFLLILTNARTSTYDGTWWIALAAVAALQAADRRGWGPTLVALAILPAVAFTGCPVMLVGPDGATEVFLGPDGLGRAFEEGTRVFVIVTLCAALAILVGGAIAAAVGRGERRQVALEEAEELRAAAHAERASAQRLSATVTERSRVARDLHDVVAHHVSLVAVRAESARYTTTDLDPALAETLGLIADDARAALAELRAVLAVLARTEDDASRRSPQPAASQLAALLATARSAGQDVAARPDGAEFDALVRDVPPQSGYVLYRVLQEALTNARRHAPDTRVDVGITRDGAATTLVASNPTAATTHAPGLGLTGLAERVELVGGGSEVTLRDGTFTLRVKIPDPEVQMPEVRDATTPDDTARNAPGDARYNGPDAAPGAGGLAG